MKWKQKANIYTDSHTTHLLIKMFDWFQINFPFFDRVFLPPRHIFIQQTHWKFMLNVLYYIAGCMYIVQRFMIQKTSYLWLWQRFTYWYMINHGMTRKLQHISIWVVVEIKKNGIGSWKVINFLRGLALKAEPFLCCFPNFECCDNDFVVSWNYSWTEKKKWIVKCVYCCIWKYNYQVIRISAGLTSKTWICVERTEFGAVKNNCNTQFSDEFDVYQQGH